NFQGFTEDQSASLIGLGSTAISNFPQAIIQNEKNAGRYGMIVSQDRLPGTLGVRRGPDDQRRGAIIEALLCHGKAQVGAGWLAELHGRLAPFIDRQLARIDGDWLVLNEGALPYARSIAAQFDAYRQDSMRRFSSAV
ncbi:MAG: coproporphyrinogen III oxidase, partial [Novosphingobium sp.]